MLKQIHVHTCVLLNGEYAVQYILYTAQDVNVLGMKGPRKMTVVIPALSRNGERIPVKPERVRTYKTN